MKKIIFSDNSIVVHIVVLILVSLLVLVDRTQLLLRAGYEADTFGQPSSIKSIIFGMLLSLTVIVLGINGIRRRLYTWHLLNAVIVSAFVVFILDFCIVKHSVLTPLIGAQILGFLWFLFFWNNKATLRYYGLNTIKHFVRYVKVLSLTLGVLLIWFLMYL